MYRRGAAGRITAAPFIERARGGAGIARADCGGDRASLTVARACRQFHKGDHLRFWVDLRPM